MISAGGPDPLEKGHKPLYLECSWVVPEAVSGAADMGTLT